MWQADAANATSLKSALGLQLRRKKCIYVWEGNHKINSVWRRVVSRNERSSCIPIRFHTPLPLSGKGERKWVSVNDITSLKLERGKQKQTCAKLSKKKKNWPLKKYYMPIRREPISKCFCSYRVPWTFCWEPRRMICELGTTCRSQRR